MTPRLDPVLSVSDFPRAELDALRLDGEAQRLDDCAVSIDEITGPILRAAVLVAELPPRLIAEQHTAAWVWGAQTDPPTRHELCSDIALRTRPGVDSRLRVREVVIQREDVRFLAGLGVTTPLRTVIDLARFVDDWTPTEARTVAALMELGEIGVLDCARAMDRRRNLPNKRVALNRIRSAAAEFSLENGGSSVA